MAASNADRNLLFGFLALQNGLIDQVQLVAAFQAWTRVKGMALADHLIQRGDIDADQRNAVELMVSLHEKKHGGRAETSLSAIFVARSARERLVALGDPDLTGIVAKFAFGSTEVDTDRTASYAVGTATSDGQRFRVVRPHARGGLGAVFVALDGELHREVALKQILDSHADDPGSRQRFLIEAEITGGLEHPGVVPVYGLGTDAAGRPYYAMRFIKGESLKETIARFHNDEALVADPGRRSLELRTLLRRFTDVCNAIDYAHSRGVIHRDIKPANIILGKHGETLVVDWGLAKATGRLEPGTESGERLLMPSSASGSSETLPGSALGTPAYMSPEQAEGQLERLGPWSDVYSLGATLYCLLTGKPPFAGDDLGAVLRAVGNGDFPLPRSSDPTIDRSLESVCLKAMSVEGKDRYATPKALADDIERWAADEPVTAWRESFGRQMRRWAKRNRTAVAVAMMAVLAALLGTVVVAGVQATANSSLRAANEEISRTNRELAAEKARVQERYNLAMDAIKTFHTGVSEDFLLKEEKFKDLRDRLLKSASDFYGKLGALLKDRSDRTSRRALSDAGFELATLTSKVGRSEDAMVMHQRVLAEREALAGEPATDVSDGVNVARSLLAVGDLLRGTGKTADALAAYERARSSVLNRAGDFPTESSARATLAASESRIGWQLNDVGKPATGLEALQRARDLQAGLAEAHPENDNFQSERASTLWSIGVVLSQTGKLAESMAAYESVLAIRRKLAEANPTVTEFQRALVQIHADIGWLLSQTGKPAEALKEYKSALGISQKLAEANPAVRQFQASLAGVHYSMGLLLMNTGDPTDAMAAYEAARVIYQGLVDANPGYQVRVQPRRLPAQYWYRVGEDSEARPSTGDL